jgi:hypothetical protein
MGVGLNCAGKNLACILAYVSNGLVTAREWLWREGRMRETH